MSNPLVDDLMEASVVPQVEIALPTRGIFYNEGEVLKDGADPDMIVVKPLSAMDESAIRDPLLMVSGHAVARLVRKTCAAVDDPGALSEIDVQAILIAARIASHGNEMALEHTCAKCESATQFKIDLNEHIQRFGAYTPEEFEEFTVTLPKSKQVVRLRPIRYIDSISMTIDMIRASSSLEALTENQNDTLDEEFIRLYKDQVEKTMNTNMSALAASIYYVETRSGSMVQDPDMIEEWIGILPDQDFKAITSRINTINAAIQKRSNLDYECQECGETTTIFIELDPQKLFTPAEDTETEKSSSASSKKTGKTAKPRSKTSQRLS